MESTAVEKRIISLSVTMTGAVLFTWLLYLLLSPFLEGIAWGAVLALVFHPLYQKIHASTRLPSSLAALMVVLTAALLFGALIVPLGAELHSEILQLVDQRNALSGTANFSFLSPYLQQLNIETSTLIGLAGKILQGVAGSLWTAGFAFFTLFFLLRDGTTVLLQLQKPLHDFIGIRTKNILETAHLAIINTFFGTILTSLSQGVLAGMGFYVAGAPVPALLGAATALFSILPFGTPLVYLPVIIYLGMQTQNISIVLALLAWCVLVVSVADNILRTLFISQTMNISFYLVFIGVVGGMLSLGFIGLFIGPALIAVGLSLWRAYTDQLPIKNFGTQQHQQPADP